MRAGADAMAVPGTVAAVALAHQRDDAAQQRG